MKKVWTQESLSTLTDGELSEFVAEICEYNLHYSNERIDDFFDEVLTTGNGKFDRFEAITFIL